MDFNFKSLNNLRANKEYLNYIDAETKRIMGNSSEISKSKINSIFPEVAKDETVQRNIDRIMSLNGNADSISENELKTLLTLLDANREKTDTPYNMDGKFDNVETSGLKDVIPGTIVYTYKAFDKFKSEEEETGMNGKIDNEFGQDQSPVCFILAPLISLSKTEFGKQLIENNIYFDKDMNVDEIFETYLMREENIPNGMVFGDSDAKALVAGVVNMIIDSGADINSLNGFSPKTMYSLLTGLSPEPATLSGDKVTTIGVENSVPAGMSIAQTEEELDYTQFKDVPLSQVPKGASFMLSPYNLDNLKKLQECGGKFSMICAGNGHTDAISKIEDDGVSVYTTSSSEIAMKYSFEEFMQIYNAGLVVMSVED